MRIFRRPCTVALTVVVLTCYLQYTSVCHAYHLTGENFHPLPVFWIILFSVPHCLTENIEVGFVEVPFIAT